LYWLDINLESGLLVPCLIIGVVIFIVVMIFSTPKTKDAVATILRTGAGGETPDGVSLQEGFNEHIKQGNAMLAQYNYDQALQHFQDALRLKSDEPAVHFKIGRIFLQKEDYKNAIAAFRTTLSLNPKQIEAHYEMARIFLLQKNMALAHQELEKAMAINPNHEEILKLKVKLLEKEDRHQEAIPFLKTLAGVSRLPLKYRSQAAEYLLQSGHVAEALEEFEALIEADPDNRLLYQGKIGQAHFSQGDYGKAIDFFTIVLQERTSIRDTDYLAAITSQMAASLCNKGVELFDSGDSTAAIHRYQEAILYDDGNADIHFNLGKALARQNETLQAIQHFQKAIALNPQDAASYYELAVLQDEKSMVQEAIASYEKVLELDPNHVNANFGLGTLYGVQNNIDKSIQYLSTAIYLNPQFVDAIYNLAVALERKKDINKAVQMYKKVINIDPGHDKARSNLAHIKHMQKQ
jgi:protein O-GlcNAc transferase